MAKITKRAVDALESCDEKPVFLWDDALSGFGVKALPSGAKRYIVKYRTNGGGRNAPQRWLTLGTHGQLTPDQARGLAQQALAAVARGEDPQGAKFKLRTAPIMRDVWKRFDAEYLPSKKPSTQSEYESQWIDLIEPKFGRQPVGTVSRGDVDKFHKAMRKTPYRANRTLALFSRLMSLAEAWDWRPPGTNPCKHIDRFPEQARTRFLSMKELQSIGKALEELVREDAVSPTAAHAIELLLLTGARVNEVLSAEWSWVDWQRGILNLPDSKTGEKPVYLGEVAIGLLERQQSLELEGPYIFPSRRGDTHLSDLRKAWVQVCKRAEITGFRLHDLRHTAASIAVGQGASLAIVGKLLGHTQAQTTLRYAHVDVDPALRAANEIGNIVGPALRPARSPERRVESVKKRRS